MSDLQSLIDQANPGDTIRVPAELYDIDAVNKPISLKSQLTLDLNGANLRALPAGANSYQIIRVWGCTDVTIIGGIIWGERTSNPYNGQPLRGDIMGNGIDIRQNSHVVIRGTQVRECMGDGILIWHNAGSVELDGVVSDKNRRQGMSIVDATGVHAHNSQFSNNGGTPPGSGIDIENDLDSETCADILIERSVFYGNVGSSIGCGGPGRYSNIRITDNDFDMVTQPIWVAGNAQPLGTPFWALLLNRSLGWLPDYRWWGYLTNWTKT